MSNQHSRLRPHGGYRRLRSFQAAEIIYDGTVSFCDRFVNKRSRTHDQMVQAARSGRQNIAEGSRASATSNKSELKLVNVARASLDELLLDYEDFLRQRKLPVWGKEDPQALAVRGVGRKYRSDQSDRSDQADHRTVRPTAEDYAPWLEHADPGVVVNALICLIHQANFLLDRQIAGLEKQFIDKGGYSEQLYAARIQERQKQNRSDQSEPPDSLEKKACPSCGKPLVLRTARKGPKAGLQFWGCSGFPECKATLPWVEKSDRSDG